jgi:RimJ/RimL family protein N-acetyltransferase
MTIPEPPIQDQAAMALDLVPVHPGLAEDLEALAGEVSAAPYLSPPCPPGGIGGWLEEAIQRREADQEYRYAILRDDGLIGLCSLRRVTAAHRTARLACLIGRRHWCRGYATEATAMLIAFGFRCLTLERIDASCFPGNAGARRVLEKLGFSHTHAGKDADPGQRLLHFEFSRQRWEARCTGA